MIESPPVFADGFGRRVVRVTGSDVPPTEHLLLAPVLAAHAGFAAALRERAAHLHGRRLTSYARVHRVETENGTLAVASEHVRGWRLADLLDVAESENLTLDIGVVMLLLRQLLPTAALLSTQISFGAAGMVGKNVTYQNADGTTGSGLVGSVTYDANGPMLVVGDKTVSLSQVQSISATASTAPATTAPTAG